MAENIQMRLKAAASKVGVGLDTIIDSLAEKGEKVDKNPNTKLTFAQLEILAKKFNKPELLSEPAPAPAAPPPPPPPPAPTPSSDPDILYFRKSDQPSVATPEPTQPTVAEEKTPPPPVVIEPVAQPQAEQPVAKEEKTVEVAAEKSADIPAPVVEPEKPASTEQHIGGLTILGKIDLPRKTTQQPTRGNRHKEAAKPTASKKEPATPPADGKYAAKPAPPTQEAEPIKAAPTEAAEETPTLVGEITSPVIDLTPEEAKELPIELIKARGEKLQGLTVLGKITLPTESDRSSDGKKKRKRKRVKRNDPVADTAATPRPTTDKPKDATVKGRPAAPAATDAKGKNKGKTANTRKDAVSDSDVKDNIKQTMARLSNRSGVDFGAKYRKEKRTRRAEQEELQHLQDQEDSSLLRVTEFISAAELASIMEVSVNEVIATCMQMGMFISINQRLDAEAIQMIALEFGFDVEFISAEEEIMSDTLAIEDAAEDLQPRAPIVTIMGHVDHGKTSLLDHIRRSKVASGEAGGITQHIGAYSVSIKEGANKGKKITFLDTPGHEAFTAMRARGAKVTDVVIIVVAADDSVMPQTREAINHALNAGVPIVFAINKIDKEGANPQKIREDLAKENILVESWGGKYQEQEVSAKKGIGIDELLDKVLLEAEMLELKANPNRRADGTVIEASLDKGRGYVTTVLIQSGTLKVGDVLLAGPFHGRVRAMISDVGKRITEAGPATPVQLLALPGAPQAGDRFNVMETEREAREIANKREQIIREQSMRAKKHITLDEIGRRKAIGTFQELNVIVKGDVDGSVEALADSLLKISTDEIQVRIIHKGVGQISESDILLASAADAIVIGFQVRPSMNARKLAEQEEIEIRLYSVIYDAINELRDALEGMLAPKEEEVIMGNIEVREVFKISKIGTVAGSYVLEGIIKRNNKVRIIRDGIVTHEGEISALKRFKDDVAEVRTGYECGISIRNFNDLQIGDIIEPYEIKEVKRKL